MNYDLTSPRTRAVAVDAPRLGFVAQGFLVALSIFACLAFSGYAAGLIGLAYAAATSRRGISIPVLLACACLMTIVNTFAEWTAGSGRMPGLEQAPSTRDALLIVANGIVLLRLVLSGIPTKAAWLGLAFLLAIGASLIACLGSAFAEFSFYRLGVCVIGAVPIIFFIVVASEEERRRTSDWLAGFLGFVVAGSFLVFPLGLGYEVNGRGFQGILLHPNTLGIFTGVWGLIALNSAVGRWPLRIVIFAVTLTLIAMSGSRTAGISFVTGLLILAANPVALNKSIGTFWVSLLMLCITVGSILFAFSMNSGREPGSDNFLSASYREDRGFLFVASVENIVQNPIVGIGFGVPSNPLLVDPRYQMMFREQFLGTAEKGNIFVAILEETGVVGLIAWTLFFASIFSFAVSRSRFALAFVIYFLLSNLAEATAFGFGGPGMFLWLALLCSNVPRQPTGKSQPILNQLNGGWTPRDARTRAVRPN